MADIQEYKGKKVIIYDENRKKTIAESEILEYDRITHLITVVTDGSISENEHVSLLVFGKDRLYEYKGTTRPSPRLSRLDIALYQGKPKEDRAYTRYSVNAKASISSMVIGGKLVPIRQEIPLDVVNLSVNGVLLRGNTNLLNLGTSFQLKLHLDGGDPALLNTTVLRVQRPNPSVSEFGCKFNFRYD